MYVWILSRGHAKQVYIYYLVNIRPGGTILEVVMHEHPAHALICLHKVGHLVWASYSQLSGPVFA